MLKVATFTIVMLAVSVYALARGQAPEKAAALLMSAAFLATVGLPYNAGRNFDHLFVGLMVIDASLFLALFAVALVANRYWPIWVAGLQLLTVAVHLVKLYDPSILPIVYARASGEIGYPMLAMLALGTHRLRQRLRANGPERDWAVVS